MALVNSGMAGGVAASVAGSVSGLGDFDLEDGKTFPCPPEIRCLIFEEYFILVLEPETAKYSPGSESWNGVRECVKLDLVSSMVRDEAHPIFMKHFLTEEMASFGAHNKPSDHPSEFIHPAKVFSKFLRMCMAVRPFQPNLEFSVALSHLDLFEPGDIPPLHSLAIAIEHVLDQLCPKWHSSIVVAMEDHWRNKTNFCCRCGGECFGHFQWSLTANGVHFEYDIINCFQFESIVLNGKLARVNWRRADWSRVEVDLGEFQVRAEEYAANPEKFEELEENEEVNADDEDEGVEEYSVDDEDEVDDADDEIEEDEEDDEEDDEDIDDDEEYDA